MKSKRGQSTLFISIVIGVMLFMVGMIAINFITDAVDYGRGTSGLNCASPTTDGVKVSCLLVDGLVPYFFLIVISAAGGYFISKLLI